MKGKCTLSIEHAIIINIILSKHAAVYEKTTRDHSSVRMDKSYVHQKVRALICTKSVYSELTLRDASRINSWDTFVCHVYSWHIFVVV